MSRAALLENLRRTRIEWHTLLSQLEDEQMTTPGVVGDWSVKDIMAHITWAERETIGILRAQAFVGSELWQLSQDERNAAVYEENKDRPLLDVRRESDAVFETLVQEAAALNEADLLNPDWFTWSPVKLPPIAVIARNSYLHYPEHIEQIRAWIQARD